MPRMLTEDEAREVVKCMKQGSGIFVLNKYSKIGYKSFGQLEREVVRNLGESWKQYPEDELKFLKEDSGYQEPKKK